MVITGAYLIPDACTRILSPQHLAQQAEDHYPKEEGTGALTTSMLNPGVRPRAGNPEVTGIPQVDYSTSRRQLTSTQAEVAYLINYPITTKPAVITN